jgi:hypothetical protein
MAGLSDPLTPDSLRRLIMGNREGGRFVQTIACPQNSGRQLARALLQKAILLAGAVGFLSFDGAAGVSAKPVQAIPPLPVPRAALVSSSAAKTQPPVIVPLDVTLEDAGRPKAPVTPAPPTLAAVLASAPAAGLVMAPVSEGDALAEVGLELLSMPPSFSITAPAAAPAGEPLRSGDKAALVPRPAAKAAAPARTAMGNRAPHLQRKYKVTEAAVEFEIPLQINGNMAGEVPLRIGSDRDISVQLASLLSLMQGRVSPELCGWLSSTYSVNSFVSFDQLRSTGIAIGYDATNDRLTLASD